MRAARNLLKSTFLKIGFDILKKERVPLSSNCELILACYALRIPFSDVLLLQVGANDGVDRDPVRHLVEELGVNAILVEPIPDVFENLKKNYTARKGLNFVNAAISDFDGVTQLFIPGNTDSGLGTQVASFDRAHVMRHIEDSRNITSIDVPVKTICTIMEDFRFTSLNILAVDTEGHDLVIVKNAFRNNIIPDVLHFENCHFSSTEKYESRKMLSDMGYYFSESIANTTAVHERVFAKALQKKFEIV